MNKIKLISIILVLVLLFTSIPILPSNADSVVIGYSGTMPSGGIPGAGGVVGVATPSFAVSFSVETFTGSDVLVERDTIETVKSKFESHFKNKFPSQTASIFFVPSTNCVIDSAIGWYDHSSGDLKFVQKSLEHQQKQLRPMGATRTTNLNYDNLYAVILVSDKNISDLAGKWKDCLTAPNGEAESLKIWSYFLQSNASSINSKMAKFLKTGINDTTGTQKEREKQMAAAWVDLMSTLWMLCPDDNKPLYEKEIDRFLKNDESRLTNPPMISISTAVRISAPNFSPKPIYLKSADYAQYLYAASPQASIYKSDWHTEQYNRDYTAYNASQPGWRQLFADAANKSLADLPNRNRKTNLSGAAATADAFNYGMGAIFSKRLRTYNGYAEWTNSSAIGALETLVFKDNLRGFQIVAPFNLLPIQSIPRGRFGIKANSPENVIVDAKSDYIGEKVKIELEIEQKGEELTAWQSRLNGTFDAGYPKLQIDLKRTTPAGSPALSTTTPWTCDNIPKPIDKAVLLQMMQNKSLQPIIYTDNTVTYPIEPEQTIEFKYVTEVKVHLSATDIITLRPNPGEARKVFMRPEEPIVVPPFVSEPSYWSEIKNGSPGNEPFEAMAGVPTTRNLYFASGGSEFIVEVNLEYVKDAETIRTYRSYFTGGVDSEFKAGDTAPNMTLGGQSANLHGGGTYTKTWTGSIPNNATAVTAKHSATCPPDPDYDEYDAALDEAEAFADEVNSTELKFTSDSDDKERKYSAWGATVNPSPHPPGSTSASVSCTYRAPSGDPPSGGSPCSNEMATANPAPDGNFTITVTWRVPAHIICGPQCCRVLPQIEDTWTQKIKHDHMKITLARVWKLDKAAVNGMIDITGTDEYKASVISGDPTLFFNIADLNNPANDGNDSTHGRIRYTVEPDMHDTVIWNEGPRSNKDDGIISQRANVDPVAANGHQNSWAKGVLYNNTGYTNEKDYHRSRGGTNTGTANTADGVDAGSIEWAKFNERRTTPNTATVISDMLILQTSSGDQSIFYFQKDSTTKQTQENFDKVAATKEEMFDDNPLSYAHMNPEDINIGSYNGKFYTPQAKYSSYVYSPVATKFDTLPAGKIRPARPSTAMRLVNTNIDIIDTIPNKYYETGESAVFYRNILNYGGGIPFYDISLNSRFSATGAEFTSTYSDNHSKVNDIVVHNPVSTEFSMVIPLANSRDQRTPSTQMIGGNLQGPTIESVKRLKNPTPKQNLIWNGDAEQIDEQGYISNWKTWESTAGKATFTKRTAADWKISGSASFELMTQANGNYKAVYYTDVPGIAGDSYSFTGKLGAHRVQGYFYINAMDSSGSILGTYISSMVNSNSAVQNLSINFTAPAGTTTLRVHIVNGNTVGYVAGYNEYVFADDLVLYDNTTTTWQPMSYTINEYVSVPNPDYVTPYSVSNPDYVAPINQAAQTKTSGSWTATVNCTINVNTYGLGRGGWEHDDHGYYYSASAYGSGKVDAAVGDVISISGRSILKNGAMVIRGNDSPLSGYYNASSCNSAQSSAESNNATITTGTGLYAYTASGSAETSFTIPAITIPAVGAPTIMVNNAQYIPAVNNPGTNESFNYTGGAQTFTAPSTGTYTFEVWGAEGGKGYASGTGGKGGYATGKVQLTKDQIINVYVGGSPSNTSGEAGNSGGWNGGGKGSSYYGSGAWGGGGGGATDIRVGGTALSNRVIVAGGGGGGGHNGQSSYTGGAGGGTSGGSSGGAGGTQSSGYTLGTGENSSYGGHDLGAGGGGYYGGRASTTSDAGGGGGSGYIGGVTEGYMSSGIRSGHGMVKITCPAVVTPAVGIPWIEGLSPTIQSLQPVVHYITTAPDSWYENVIVTIPAAQPITIPSGGTFTPGNFINLDYGFQIYFPNRGNFFGDNSYGIANVTKMRGKGYINNMDTTEWTKEKYVVFDFNVIHNGIGYVAGQDVPLDVHDDDGIYNFYCPLANSEAVSAEVTFKVIANNGNCVDNEYMANRERYNYFDARHSGIKRFNIDVVGRIGNMILEDTGDFRFANLFKMPKTPTSWIVPNVVKAVEQNQQNKILGSRVDIRGVGISAANHWLNTYGLLGAADKDPIAFPLTPDKNNISALQKQPLRIGYKSFMDIQTLGNYSNGSMQIIPYYYRLDLTTGALKQVDMYMDVDGQYKPINIFGAAVPGWDTSIVYNNATMLNWDDEFDRRNYTAQEKARTEAVASAFQVYDTSGNVIDLPIPQGKYHTYGNNQILQLNGRNRSFIGTSIVNGTNNTNPGNVFSDILFGRQGQRWHFTAGLPSSAVAVEHNQPATQANIDAMKSNTSVILMALDIKAIGDTYVLQYNGTGENSSITIAGAVHNLSAVPYPIVAVMSSSKSAADDLELSGTH